MRRTRKGFLVFHDILDLLEEMPAESVKRVLMSVGRFSEGVSNGEKPQEDTFRGLEKVAYIKLRDGVEYSNYKYTKSAAYNRARRLKIENPQAMSYHDLYKRGFSISDIAIFKDTDEDEVESILDKSELDIMGLQQNQAVADLVNEYLPQMKDVTRGELTDYINTCFADGKEAKLRKALQLSAGLGQKMTMNELRAYMLAN